MVAGASIGAVLGSSIGALTGGHRGYHLGTVVGTVAGATAGAIATAPRQPDYTDRGGDDDTYEKQAPTRRRSQEYDDRCEQTGDRRVAETHGETPVSASASPLTLHNLRFVDGTRNQRLNREETCEMVFELMNHTHHVVHNVVPYISETNGNPHIYLSPSTRIEQIAPGEGVRYTATVKTDNRLKPGTARFRIAVSCNEDDFVTLREFEIPTEK